MQHVEKELADPLPDQPVNRELLEALRENRIGKKDQSPNFELGSMEYGNVWKDLLVSNRYRQKYHQVTVDFE